MGSGGINKNNNDLGDLEAARLRARTAGKKADDGRQDVQSVRANTPAPSGINLLDRLRDREIGRGGPNWRRRVLRERYGSMGDAKVDTEKMIDQYQKKIDKLVDEFNDKYPEFERALKSHFQSQSFQCEGRRKIEKSLMRLTNYKEPFEAYMRYSFPELCAQNIFRVVPRWRALSACLKL